MGGFDIVVDAGPEVILRHNRLQGVPRDRVCGVERQRVRPKKVAALAVVVDERHHAGKMKNVGRIRVFCAQFFANFHGAKTEVTGVRRLFGAFLQKRHGQFDQRIEILGHGELKIEQGRELPTTYRFPHRAICNANRPPWRTLGRNRTHRLSRWLMKLREISRQTDKTR